MREVIAKELVLDNFKSFARKTTIPLLSGFTTISGPNGSGKSNLLDSILFCLGLTSSKSLRAERLPDLINNRSSRNEARVTLRLIVKRAQEQASAGGKRADSQRAAGSEADAGVEGEPIAVEGPKTTPEGDEIVEITRLVKVGKNDYHSAYYLDGKPVSLQTLHDRLAELNISPKGHNIVMQGDVTRILTMGPIERRRIIDDLAGVGEFDDRIESAKKEMSEAERHMESTRILATELTMRLEALKGEREAALAYLGIKREKERLEKTLLSRRHSDASRNLASVRTRIGTLSREFTALNDEALDLDGQFGRARERFNELDREIQEMTDRDRVGGFAEQQEIKEKLLRSTSYTEHVDQMVAEHARRQAELTAQFKAADLKKAALNELLKVDRAERSGLEAQLGAKKADMESLQKRMESVSEANCRSLADLPSLRRQLEECRDLVVALRTEDQRLAIESVGHEEKQLKTRGDTERLTGQISAAKAVQKKKNEELKTAAARTQQITYDLHDARALLKDRKARLTDLHEQFSRALQQYSKLEGMKAAGDAAGAGGLSLVLNSGIPGIHGRVADLAEIPESYRIAVESACGRRLDFVVVSDENVAVKAIDLLKQRKMGRVTFLPMTKVRGVPVEPVGRRGGIIGTAIDLIKFDPKYREIFSFVVGDTLVIDRIQTGLPLMGQHRMVTLEGDLLEKTGAMTGGSPPAPRRPTAELDLVAKKRALDAMEAEARTIRTEIPALEEKISRLEEQLQSARKVELDLNAELGHLARELDRLTTEQSSGSGELDRAVKGIARVARERETLVKELAKAAEQVKSREELLASAENSLAKGVSKELSEEVKYLSGQIHDLEEKIRVVRERIRGHELEVEFHQKDMANARREHDELTEKIETLSEQAKVQRKEQEQLRKRADELAAALEAVLKELGAKRSQREQVTAEMEKITTRRDELKVELVRREAELNEAKAREAGLAEDVARLSGELAQQGIDPAEFTWKGPVRDLEQAIQGLGVKLEEMGAVNLLAIEQAQELEERLGQLRSKLDTLERERQELLDRMAGFGRMKTQAFMKTFVGVRDAFERIYADLSGGNGELTLENPDDPFAGGLIIRACPKGKDMKRMEALSGGEKSLAALAFVFSFQTFRPAPFYIFDEVDMFLDNPNTERLGDMIRRQASSTQFIVVSLKKCMIERSHRTVGVYAREGGFSQVAGLDLTALEQVKEAEVGAAGPWN